MILFWAISSQTPIGHPSVFGVSMISAGKRLSARGTTSSTQTRRRAPEEVSYALLPPSSHSHTVSRVLQYVPRFSWLVSKDLAAFQKAKSAEVGSE